MYFFFLLFFFRVKGAGPMLSGAGSQALWRWTTAGPGGSLQPQGAGKEPHQDKGSWHPTRKKVLWVIRKHRS